VNSSYSFLAFALIVVLVLGFLVIRKAKSPKTAQPLTPSISKPVFAPELTADALDDTGAQIAGTLDSDYVAVDEPESMAQRSAKLRDRMGRSQGSLGQVFRKVFSGSEITDDAWQDLEDTLIMADLGVTAATGVVQNLKTAVKKSGTSRIIRTC
jgi:fused signal recognition particle receptor